MKEKRIQVRADSKLKEEAQKVAARRKTTVSALVVQYLQGLVDADRIERELPAGDVPQV
jgi:antitoxin component of RelBE/YafQ-DinJ toxin-antitoxin module